MVSHFAAYVIKACISYEFNKLRFITFYTHCYGHALNLAIQETAKSNIILRDTLDTMEEMTKLIKKSPKRRYI